MSYSSNLVRLYMYQGLKDKLVEIGNFVDKIFLWPFGGIFGTNEIGKK